MDASTITFLGGMITCLIGVATFVIGMNSRAQKSGILEQKIEQAIDGIEEIKGELRSSNKTQGDLAIKTTSHEQQIDALSTRIKALEEDQKAIEAKLDSRERLEESLIQALKSLGGEVHRNG